MKKVLTIAGSDCSGGAGIQADLKTMCAHNVYGMSAITAITAQNTLEVVNYMEATPQILEQQLDCIFTDIYPDAIKIGMVSNPEIIRVIVKKLKEYKATNIVVDPVMVSTSGSKLMSETTYTTLIEELLPMATIITPNILEAEILSNIKIYTKEDMMLAAMKIATYLPGAVLLKGGHLVNEASDLLYNGQIHWYEQERIDNENTHGTGCTLSSAIACNLAKENPYILL